MLGGASTYSLENDTSQGSLQSFRVCGHFLYCEIGDPYTLYQYKNRFIIENSLLCFDSIAGQQVRASIIQVVDGRL
jgi:hypothetical protein